jgi:hypothetical protein
MMLKMFGGVVLALGLGLAGTTSAVPTAPATDCCALGLSCCPDGPCCTGSKTLADCCAAGLPCCDPPSACCLGVKVDCCAAGAACCPDGPCCLTAKGARVKAHDCCAAPSKAACCCTK